MAMQDLPLFPPGMLQEPNSQFCHVPVYSTQPQMVPPPSAQALAAFTQTQVPKANNTGLLRKDVNKARRSKSPREMEPKTKKMRKNGSHTPLAILNEIRPGLQYKIVASNGPPHCPNFLASVEVDGTIFTGSANSKKQAKQCAAEASLLTLCPSLLTPADNIDFSKDTPEKASIQPLPKKLKQEALVTKALGGQVNPVMALNELIPGLKYDCMSDNSSKFSPFVYQVVVDSTTYQGSGSSKKNAKAAAARSVLLQKFGAECASSIMNASFLHGGFLESGGPTSLQPVAANKIVELVLENYHSLMEGSQDFAKRKVLAGIVMSSDEECTNLQLISFGTGTKCVGGEHISVKGAVLNDSHAEIVARRGLMRFLYHQLLMHKNPANAPESIFEINEKGGFRLKSNYRFHLYISTSPCGDARIFSPHESDSPNEEVVDRHPNRQSRGQLRTKIESGEGTIPVKSADSIQTWDGVIQGARLLTMSCSDKIAKWNVVGLQGSLLSHYIEPIYLHSLIIGSLYHPSHLRRALFNRIENTLVGLPVPFHLNKLKLNTTSSPESRHTAKAPNHSANWICGDDGVEILNAMTGKINNSNVASRLCKQRFFALFHELHNAKLPSRSGLAKIPEIYSEVKLAEPTYTEAKIQMMLAFKKANLGTWMKKPIEQDFFELDLNLDEGL